MKNIFKTSKLRQLHKAIRIITSVCLISSISLTVITAQSLNIGESEKKSPEKTAQGVKAESVPTVFTFDEIIPDGLNMTRCNSFNSSLNTWIAVMAGGKKPLSLRPLSPSVLLPDGSEFKTWELPAKHNRTFYVAQRHPDASDNNSGSEEQPWKTIGRAAATLKPGDRVIVREGIYREWVRPSQGGAGPTEMITYQAAEGQEVIISGADIYKGSWNPSVIIGKSGKVRVWMISLSEEMFPDGNPFAKINAPNFGPAATNFLKESPYILAQGLVFQDGQRLVQKDTLQKLTETPGTYWVEPGAKKVYIRPFEDKKPSGVQFEITTRPFAFAPEKAGFGFIRVCGFTVEYVSSYFPIPQLGAISAMQGHHWIIENNLVQQINGLGLDIGRRQTYVPHDVPEDTPPLAGVGHIVRNNMFIDCGVCSISGLGVFGGLIEGNYTRGSNWQDPPGCWEDAGIKLHYLKHTLVRRNIVVDPIRAGLWMDHSCVNSRITENIVFGGGKGEAGIYIEATYRHNLIDHNIVWNYDGPAFLANECSKITIANNLFGNCTQEPVRIRESNGRVLDIDTKRPSFGRENQVIGNIFYGFGEIGPKIPEGNISDGNLFVNPPGKDTLNLNTWIEKTWQEKNSRTFVSEMTFSYGDWILRQSPLLPAFECPYVFELSSDYFGTKRPTTLTTGVGPFLKQNMKPEMKVAPPIQAVSE